MSDSSSSHVESPTSRVYSPSYLRTREWILRYSHTEKGRLKRREAFYRYLKTEKGQIALKKARTKQYLRCQEIRRQARNLFGDCCQCCGSQTRLHLHHLDYPNGHNGHYVWVKTAQEALANPLNFALVCGSCHSKVTLLSHTQPEIISRILDIVKSTKGRKIVRKPEH